MACNPPLNLVANGPAGQLPILPLDPTPPTFSNSPTFTDTANALLGNLATDDDGWNDAVQAATDTVTLVGTTAATMDADLDAILALLATDPGTDPISQGITDFGSDVDGISSFVDAVDPTQLPTLSPIPLVTPGGQGTVTFGGSPSTGGVPNAGEPAYTLQVALPGSGAYDGAPTNASLSGPNPPFTGELSFQQIPNAAGKLQWFAMVGINPAQSGSFTATVAFDVVVTITGITGVLHVTTPINVVVN